MAVFHVNIFTAVYVQVDSQPKSSGLVLGQRPLGAILHSSNEPGELSHWLCHDDSTINIVLDIIIIYIAVQPAARDWIYRRSGPGFQYSIYIILAPLVYLF